MILWFFFFFKQKTAYEMRISDWSSDVCSSDLDRVALRARYAARADRPARRRRGRGYGEQSAPAHPAGDRGARADLRQIGADPRHARRPAGARVDRRIREAPQPGAHPALRYLARREIGRAHV